MSLLHNIVAAFSRKSVGETSRPLSLTNTEGWGVEPVASGVRVNERSALTLSAVWGCVNLLAGTIASLPLVVYRGSGSDRKVAYDHPLYRLLHDSPNFDQTSMDFWEGGQAALELRGNMHAFIERSGGRPVALKPIWGVTARRERDGSIRYRWTDNGKSYDEPEESVFHIRGFGGDPLGGLSTLTYARQTFGLYLAVNRATASAFANGVRPSIAFTTDKILGDQRKPIEDGLAAKHAGAMNAGRPLLLEGGLTPHPLSLTPEDAQMLEQAGFGIEEACRFFGVSPHMIGHTAGNTQLGSSIEEQTSGFEKYTLRRRLKRNEQAAQKQLLTPADRAAGITIEYNMEGLLRGDSKGRAEFYERMTRMGAMTINEVRAKENLPPVPGGDVPRLQSQNVPINLASQPTLIAGGGE